MNNLKKFSTEAEYGSATLNYPAVSWVTGTDTVHFDKAGAVVNNKVKIAFTTDACGQGKSFNLVPESGLINNINSLTVNGEPFTPPSCGGSYELQLEANTDYLIEYELKDDVSNVSNWFAIQPAEGCSSTRIKYDLLFPAQVDEINGLQNSINNIIFETETPPTVTFNVSDITDIVGIYVPDSAVNTYKSASVWYSLEAIIYPISQYSGNIPT
jgi:hypothetical protein